MERFHFNQDRNKNRKTGKKKSFLCCLLTASLLCGCTPESFGNPRNVEEDLRSLLSQSPVMEYEVPKSQPNVLVDQVGYEVESDKTVIFRGDNLENTFQIIDKESGETVYTGDIVLRENKQQTGETISYGSFSELEREGTYYIQTAVIGQSYPFLIKEDLYYDLFLKMAQKIYDNRIDTAVTNGLVRKPQGDISGGWITGENSERGVSEGCLIAENLMLISEFYPNEMTDSLGIPESGNQIPDMLDEVKYEVDFLIKMQDSKTGSVYSGITNGVLSEATLEATGDFAGVMAQFYKDYYIYDTSFARECLSYGEKAWKYMRSVSTEKSSQELYQAAAQLYKATGKRAYRDYIREYFAAHTIDKVREGEEIYGDVAYLTTTYKVDTSICRKLVEKWMNLAEEIVEESKNNPYDVTQDSHEKILYDMMCLSVIDHIITNHEYITVLENHIHYFLGRNPMGVSYISDLGIMHLSEKDNNMEITRQPQLTSTLLVMLGEVITKDLESASE